MKKKFNSTKLQWNKIIWCSADVGKPLEMKVRPLALRSSLSIAPNSLWLKLHHISRSISCQDTQTNTFIFINYSRENNSTHLVVKGNFQQREKKNKNHPTFQNSPDVFSLLTVKPWIIHFNLKSPPPPQILLSSKTIVQFAKVILICQTEIFHVTQTSSTKKGTEGRKNKRKKEKEWNESKNQVLHW